VAANPLPGQTLAVHPPLAACAGIPSSRTPGRRTSTASSPQSAPGPLSSPSAAPWSVARAAACSGSIRLPEPQALARPGQRR